MKLTISWLKEHLETEASVDEIATIFWATKGVKYSDPVADVRFGT